MPTPRPEHGRICLNAGFVLETYGRQTGLGWALTNDSAVVTERDPDTVRGADVCFYRHDRWPRADLGPGLPPVVPDLVVEIFSPSDRASKMLAKVSEYLDAGVPMVWVLHPKGRRIAVYRVDDEVPAIFGESDFLEHLPELPGFRCAVAEFFA